MVSIVPRMRKLRAKVEYPLQLLAIRLGPGAAILPPEVTRIHMDFAINIHDGHYGPRKFWRNCLPRLKYHNPAVPMTVNRTNNQEGPALMTIYFTTPEAAENTRTEISSTTQSHTSTGPVAASQPGPLTERTEVINMKHRLDSEILDQLMSLTKARAVRATAEELRQIQEMEEQNARSERDALKMAEVNEKRKREEAILTQARGEIEASTG